VNNCKGTKNALVRQKGSGVSGEKEKVLLSRQLEFKKIILHTVFLINN
jgi:hypothetical protein